MSIIEARGLSKSFMQAVKEPGLGGAVKHLFLPRHIEKVAVKPLDLSVEAGETVAYVGPNGAGKSTTIKMLTGILMPSAGTVSVNGINPYKKRMDNAAQIGAVFGQRTQLWWDIPIVESFSLLKDIYQIPGAVYKTNMELFTEMLGMSEFIHLSARKLSLGQRMRADLAAALLHNPPILYLDEPTIGLDVSVKQKIREFIKQINQEQNTTVMLTTHDLGDIEDLCKRLIIIDHGAIIYDGSLSEVKARFAKNRVIFFQVGSPMPELYAQLAQTPGMKLAQQSAQEFSVSFDRYEYTASEVVGRVMRYGEVVDFRMEDTNIEQVIKAVYDGKLDLTGTGE
ncbi:MULTISPECIES: ABC transporter ATP-binding protein [Paenibacillus]|uniref:ATP-binding cassette domain-containing protein n=1 Tax=Paenibacillus phytohabitans TaxID=2654978 RepID=A0ABX1YEA9_9BACL|nr:MULTISPECIES: ATP-binding cassette domain-containing protein [Paenibacillus]AIQ32662.1 sugar ABC transporter ATP-binding protein [Paenibacillus sp. FSL P4-0081]NOU79188.1 ATP-binding cassette domain-containing protein [Paenibacillus phytohabitans]